MTITLTAAAAERVRAFLKKRDNGIGLRFGVKKTGCSGFAYTTDFIDIETPDDIEFESNGIKIFVDKKNLSYLDGTEIDYKRDGLQESFRFNNPNVADECGCGESFTVAKPK